jgi:hypothetical protein
MSISAEPVYASHTIVILPTTRVGPRAISPCPQGKSLNHLKPGQSAAKCLLRTTKDKMLSVRTLVLLTDFDREYVIAPYVAKQMEVFIK